MAVSFRPRRGTFHEWEERNPRLGIGEMGFEVDSHRYKLGDGFRRWNDLPYFANWDTTLEALYAIAADLKTGPEGPPGPDGPQGDPGVGYANVTASKVLDFPLSSPDFRVKFLGSENAFAPGDYIRMSLNGSPEINFIAEIMPDDTQPVNELGSDAEFSDMLVGGWHGAGAGGTMPDVSVEMFNGDPALKVIWHGDTSWPSLAIDVATTPGKSSYFYASVYCPNPGGTSASVAVQGLGYGESTEVRNQYINLGIQFTPTQNVSTLLITPGPGDDVATYLLYAYFGEYVEPGSVKLHVIDESAMPASRFDAWNVHLSGSPGPRGLTGGVTEEELQAHVDSELPHPTYEDGADLTLLYENAKV